MRSPLSRRQQPDTDGGGADARAAARRQQLSTQELIDERGSSLGSTVVKTLLGVVLVAAVLVGIFFGASALEGDTSSELAPWNSSSAPIVKPDPLSDQ